MRWILDAEYRRTLKLDADRERWHEGMEQLGLLRTIRARRVVQGTHWKSDDAEEFDTSLRFPWKEQKR